MGLTEALLHLCTHNRPLYTYINRCKRAQPLCSLSGCCSAARLKELSCLQRIQTHSSLLLNGYRRVKRPGREAESCVFIACRRITLLCQDTDCTRGVQLSSFGKGPHPFLWAESRTASDKAATFGLSNGLKYCIFLWYLHNFKK